MSEPSGAVLDLAEFIDRQPIGRFHVLVILLCAAAMFMDGFDTQALGYVAPRLISSLHLRPDALGLVFGIGGLGILLGTIGLAPVADRIGRKPVMLVAMLVFAIASFSMSLAHTASQFMWIRLVTGLGLGGLAPNALSLAAEYMPRRLRVTLVLMVWFGFSVGSGFGGPIAASILRSWSWQGVFVFGGLLPAMMVPLVAWRLPESLQVLRQRDPSDSRIASTLRRMTRSDSFAPGVRFTSSEKKEEGFPVALLFKEGRARLTTLLWIMFFMNLLALFFLNSWLPTILHTAGITERAAIIITGLLHFGGIAGALVLAPLCDKFNRYVVLGFAFILAGVGIASIGVAGHLALFAMVATVFTGFFTFGGQNTVNALAATLYPTPMRSTGVGWALGIGRSAQIVGPILGGVMLNLHWPTSQILYLMSLPSLVAAASAALLWSASRRVPSSAEALAK